MNKHLILLSICLFFISTAYSQKSTRDIISNINTPIAGQGRVKVMQDETIDSYLALPQNDSGKVNIIRLSDERMNGFKIQVFTGNDQSRSRAKAEERQAQLRQEFPQHQAEVTYNSPSWRLRVGNFVTKADAEIELAKLKKAFPSFSKEMYIVPDTIRRPLN